MADDLRQRYAEALKTAFGIYAQDPQPLSPLILDAVLAVRDGELEQLKDDALMVVAESAQERDEWRERAELAEAAIARVRQQHRVHRCEDGHQRTSTPNPCFNNRMCSCGHRDPCPTLAALNDTDAS